MSRISPELYFHSTNGPLQNRNVWCIFRAIQAFQIYHRPLWAKNTIPHFTWFPHRTENYFSMKKICMGIEIWCSPKLFSVSCGNIVLLKGKVLANLRVFRCLRSFQCLFQLNGKAWISRVSFLNPVNRPSESDFTAFQKLVGVPASLYNLIKSAPEPYRWNSGIPMWEWLGQGVQNWCKSRILW